MKRSLLLMSLITILFCSCKKDPIEPGKYKSGVFVVNEGKFGDGTGTILHFDPVTRQVNEMIFQNENPGKVLGNIAQSMHVVGQTGYVLINNNASIQAVNIDDFIEDVSVMIDQPRFMISNQDRVFVSAWGVDGFSGLIGIYDHDLNEIKRIDCGGGPEKMLLMGDELYVCKSGGFGRDSIILVVDLNSNSISDTIQVSDNPIGIQKDSEGGIWVLSRGHSDFFNPDNNTEGALQKIVNKQVVSRFGLSNGASELINNFSKSALFFNMDGQVYRHDIDDLNFENEVFIDRSFYALSLDPVSGNIYAADAKDFSSNGEVVIFDDAGEELHSFEAGIIPTDFYFKN